MESAGAGRGLAISIVSHGHGASVQALLNDMAAFSSGAVTRVVLTMNLPEPGPAVPVGGWPFALEVRRNAAPLGFGANHNRALDGAREAFVGVLNPDVVLAGADPLPGLLEQARRT